MSKSLSEMHEQEILSNERFEFGKNWSKFIKSVDSHNIEEAKRSLIKSFGLSNLVGYKFLDAGSGSGLFSLAAYQLGASVTSFDYDLESVECTKLLREKYCENHGKWSVLHGSVLDEKFITDLGKFDIVYSWGVLHHTGSMWHGMENLLLCRPEYLYIAIYNDQGLYSRYWKVIKVLYNKNLFFRVCIVVLHFPYLYLLRKLKNILRFKSNYRGMKIWTDMLDWLGGLPFEVATPSEIVKYYNDKKFLCGFIKTVGSKLGCNEYLFIRKD